MTTIRYTIDVPEQAIPELQALMKRHDAHFDSKRQITAINDIFMEASTAMGHHVPDLVSSMNRHLKVLGLTPLVPTDHQDWDLNKTQEFLKFAVTNFKWQDNLVQEDWWQDEYDSWEALVRDNPFIFQQ